MRYFMEGRESDSPYVEMVWQGESGPNYTPTCPADANWNLLILKHGRRIQVLVEGPLTKAKYKEQPEGAQFLVVKFKLGAYLSYLPVTNLLDDAATLPEGAGKSFYLNGSLWQLPSFDNVETFVARMVREELLVSEPVVKGVLQNEPQAFSARTVRRRFLHATGLTPTVIHQIERAKQAMMMLQDGMSILDTVFAAGYADQPHLTRSLKRFVGATPAELAWERKPEVEGVG
jgi:hypothetical protein